MATLAAASNMSSSCHQFSPARCLKQTSPSAEIASTSAQSCPAFRCYRSATHQQLQSALGPSRLSTASQEIHRHVCYGESVHKLRNRRRGRATAVMAPEKESSADIFGDEQKERINNVLRPREAIEAAIRAKEQMGKNDTDLQSTNAHRAWVAFGAMALLGLMGKALIEVHSLGSAATCVVSILGAYLLADLGTGIYHWSVDNYGDAKTPVVGPQIDAFQGHHRRPWTITKREFSNNLQALARPIGFSALPFLLAPSNVGVDAFMGTFLGCVMCSQLFHAWSHCKKSELPLPVLALQDAGLVISRTAHGAHHRPPFDINYCIVSGVWNGILKDTGFFKKLEMFIFTRTGVAPRSWSEAAADWEIYETTTYFEDGDVDESEAPQPSA